MIQHTIFRDCIWEDTLDGLDYSALVDRTHQIKNNENTNTQKSNRGGWQSSGILEDESFEECFSLIQKKINDVIKDYGFHQNVSADLSYAWANINNKGDYNTGHLHAHSMISGVLYLKAHGADQGLIGFDYASSSEIKGYHYPYEAINDFNDLNSNTFFAEPITGRLLLFPGWQKHFVLPNKTDEERVSISFNSMLKNN
jgi:uncharacterized protein (TIGR02466 family)